MTLRKYAPMMKPDYVFLGFFENDFNDNLVPVNRYLRTESGTAVAQFSYSDNEYSALDKHQILDRMYESNQRDRGDWWRNTRITYLVSNAIRARNTVPPKQAAPGSKALEVTRRLIEGIADCCRDNNIVLVILTMPERSTVLNPDQGERYRIMMEIAQEQAAVLVDPIALLGADDYAPLPDNHWNTLGHQLVGQYLFKHFQEIQ